MQTSHRAYCLGAAEVHLRDRALTPGFNKSWLLGTKAIEESTAVITEGLAQQLPHTVDRGGPELSGHRLPRHTP